MLFSAVQQESAVSIYMSPPSWGPSHPSPPDHSRSSESPRLGSLCYKAASHYPPTLDEVVYIGQGYSLISSHPLFPPLSPRPSLHLPWAVLVPVLSFHKPNSLNHASACQNIWGIKMCLVFLLTWLTTGLGRAQSIQLTNIKIFYGERISAFRT